MNTPTKTNPAYAALAYRRTILNEVVFHLRRKFLGVDGDPQSKLVCEEVLYTDHIVPLVEVEAFVDDLIDEEAQLSIEMGQFEFKQRHNGQSSRTKARRSGWKARDEERTEEGESDG